MTRHGRRPSLIGRPTRRYHRAHGVRYFHACYSVGDVTLRGVNRRKRGAGNTLAALRLPTMRAQFSDLVARAERELSYRSFLAKLLWSECEDRDWRRFTATDPGGRLPPARSGSPTSTTASTPTFSPPWSTTSPPATRLRRASRST